MSDRISWPQLADIIRKEGPARRVAVILGSGLSIRYSGQSTHWPVDYREIDGLTGPDVAGHAGSLFPFGRSILVFSGRSHPYESGSIAAQDAMIGLAANLGCKRLLITQAAGSLRPTIPTGSWLSASDIIPFPFRYKAPDRILSGSSQRKGSGRGIPLISAVMKGAVEAAAAGAGVLVRSGILAWTSGPNFETRAESMMMEGSGADAVTMSPLPELIAAGNRGMLAASLSWITNHTANVSFTATGHDGVLSMGEKGGRSLEAILKALDKSIRNK